MNRLAAWLLLATLVACAPDGPDGRDPRETPPHVLILVMDTTRGDRCSLNGFGRETTPRLSALAREGVVFRNAWSPAGWTGPAHASLFTGLRPESHGFLRGVRDYLQRDALALAERFRDAGYRTACLSNNNTISAEFGLVQGFGHVRPLFLDRSRPYPWASQTPGTVILPATRGA